MIPHVWFALTCPHFNPCITTSQIDCVYPVKGPIYCETLPCIIVPPTDGGPFSVSVYPVSRPEAFRRPPGPITLLSSLLSVIICPLCSLVLHLSFNVNAPVSSDAIVSSARSSLCCTVQQLHPATSLLYFHSTQRQSNTWISSNMQFHRLYLFLDPYAPEAFSQLASSKFSVCDLKQLDSAQIKRLK